MEVGDPVKALLKIREEGKVIDCMWVYGVIKQIDPEESEPRFKVEVYNSDPLDKGNSKSSSCSFFYSGDVYPIDITVKT